ALRGPLRDHLLSGNTTLYWILVTAVVAFGGSYFARGFLAGSRNFALYGALLIAESCARVSFALAVAVGLFGGQTAVALGVAAAPVLSLVVVLPLVVRTRVVAAVGRRPRSGEGDGSPFTLTRGGGFAAAVLVIMLSEQTLINAGPLL